MYVCIYIYIYIYIYMYMYIYHLAMCITLINCALVYPTLSLLMLNLFDSTSHI